MAEYTVVLKTYQYHEVEVEAENEAKARDKAEAAFSDGWELEDRELRSFDLNVECVEIERN